MLLRDAATTENPVLMPVHAILDFRSEFSKKCDMLPTMWSELNPEIITMSKKVNCFERSRCWTSLGRAAASARPPKLRR